ncbi:hypothetical protein PanWU01x14_184820, partial [Parasponia andersonii]
MTVTPDPIEVSASKSGRDKVRRVLPTTEDAKIHNDVKNVLGGLKAILRREIESLYSKIAK